jgi:hypothetical protein
MWKQVVIGLALVAGCGKGKQDDGAAAGAPGPAAGSGSGSAVAKSGAADPVATSGAADPAAKRGTAAPAAKPGAAAPAAKPKRPPPTRAQKADYRMHMKAGWKRQKAKAWGEAVPEFEAALVAIPLEQRALSELGWSAMNAGDFPRARSADEASIAVAVDKNVKAAGYYNLGLVQQKTGDSAGALKSFLASIALRPNKTVQDAVARLGGAAAADPAGCEAGKSPCECAEQASVGVDPDDATCTEGTPPAGAPGFHVWRLASKTGTNWYEYLFDDTNQYVAGLGLDADHGRHNERAAVDKLEVKTIGGHRVLWIETTQHDDASYLTGDDGTSMETIEGRLLSVCALGDGKAPARCALRDVWLERQTDEEFVPDDPDGAAAKHHAPRSERTVLSAVLGADGVVTLKLQTGPSDEQIAALLGPHRLW